VASGYFIRMLARRVRTDGFIDPCVPTLAAAFEGCLAIVGGGQQRFGAAEVRGPSLSAPVRCMLAPSFNTCGDQT
jgi:hypothetical protein